jgi:HK97 family phage portal protein
MGVIDRIRNWMGLGPWSGSPGPPGGTMYPTEEGWISSTWGTNYGQRGYDPIKGGWNSVVYACIMRYAMTIAQLPGYHKKYNLDTNGTEDINNSALARILKKPNSYQTRSDFMRNMVMSLLSEGNAYALGLRNDRNEVTELHQFQSGQCRAYYGPPFDGNTGTPGEVFYSVGGNPVLEYWNDPAWKDGLRWVVPARDILHFCGPSQPNDPLKGESPLVAGGLPVALSSGAGGQLATFFGNAARPSGILMTDLTLTATQVNELRDRWDLQTKGVNAGGTPILSAGLKWEKISLSAQEMQIAEMMKLSKEDIAMLFGIPLAMLNDMTGATYNNTEQLIMVWLRMGLGYYIDQIELSFDKMFGLEKSQEYTFLDTDEALLRTDFKTRVEGLKNAVQGGIYAPNEARKKEGLPKAKDGDEPRVQQQVVPLSAWELAPPKTPAPPPAAGTEIGGDEPKPDDETPPATDEPAKDAGPDDKKRLLDDILERVGP